MNGIAEAYAKLCQMRLRVPLKIKILIIVFHNICHIVKENLLSVCNTMYIEMKSLVLMHFKAGVNN